MNVNDEMNISPEPSVLNSNAAAGLLQQIFAVDVTRASITCVACESVQPLASLRLFGLPMGYILSCPQCHATLIRGADTSARVLTRLPRCLNATSQNRVRLRGRYHVRAERYLRARASILSTMRC